jgi:hypothetical protein
VQAHVDPSAVLLVAGALLQEGVGDLVVDVLLLYHVLVGELHMAIQILQPDRLAKADELVVDEAISDVVELVDVLHNCLDMPDTLDFEIRCFTFTWASGRPRKLSARCTETYS